MKLHRTVVHLAASLSFLFLAASAGMAETVLDVKNGAVNQVLLKNDGRGLAVYGWTGDEAVDMVLLSHGRRDLASAARPLIHRGVAAVAPIGERYGIEKCEDYWRQFKTTRFHDYGQQSTKILRKPLAIERWVKDGDIISWRGVALRVVETPGYTRGSVSYVARIDGRKIAFTGDLIYGDGKILDLYSFQDAIPGAQIRGYHGYGARLASLVSSLEKIKAEKPDLLVPARGPMIKQPIQAIDRLIERVRGVYQNYLSTNALHWYFKEDRMRRCGARVLGSPDDVELMPYSHHEKTPDWVYENSTSRLLISKDGHGFLLDCGNQRVIDGIQDLIRKEIVKKVEGIFVTHYHDDHTDRVQAAAEAFGCPVYATKEYADVLEKPEAYHLPAMTANPIKNVQIVADGQVMKWRDLTLTFFFFPGQTYYHGALLAEKPNAEKPIFFVGDAFAPSGIDDYCVLNRNLLHEDQGYLLCLKKVRARRQSVWLVNEHIPYVFSFDEAEMKYIESRYRARIDMLRELFPWDDPNYGVDEQWAVFYPHGAQVSPGETLKMELRITNHSPVAREFRVKPQLPSGWSLADDERGERTLKLGPRQVGAIVLGATASNVAGDYVITADVRSDGMEFGEWSEALVTVK